MRHLLLLRHAKAVSAERGMADRDRPLTPRGHRDARLIGAAIAADGPPDLVLCSPSRRTRETLAGVLEKLAAEPKVVFATGLYEGQGSTYAEAIAAQGDGAKRLLVIGHNPTIHATALAFAITGDRARRAALAAKFPTGALAVIAIEDDDWRAIRPGTGELVSFLRPRDLDARHADD